jgi:DNA-binding protein HU-beta
MNKQELIAAVAEDTGMSKVAAERAVNSVFENITAQLGVGETVALLGFGTFGSEVFTRKSIERNRQFSQS